jgi:two-component system response regulator DevR
MDRKKILLVDDHEVVRIGLKALIDRQPAMEVVGEAANAPEAVAQAQSLRPDVVLMDIRLGTTSGIDACQQITAQLPETKVIMLTSYAEDEMLFAAVRTGAAGYVLKQAGGQEVIRAIHSALEGATMLDPTAAESVFSAVRRAARSQGGGAFAGLNGPEQRVLARITTGDTNREIAMRLHLGEGTVRNYVSNILEKLDVANRAEAAAYATKHKLCDLLDHE